MNGKVQEIILMLDLSGSMVPFKEILQKGAISIIQAALKKYSRIILGVYGFNDALTVLFNRKEVSDENIPTLPEFHPQKISALFYCLNQFFLNYERMFIDTNEHPKDVKMFIISDGMDNSPLPSSRTEAIAVIKKFAMQYNWQFFYTTVQEKVETEAESLGINASNGFHFAYTSEGLIHLMKRLAEAV